MSAPKEGNAGEIKLYREHPLCLIVKIIDTPDDDEMWKYDCEILAVLESPWDKPGDKFSVSKSKEDGQMANWFMWDLNSPYAKGWIDGSGFDLSRVL